mgnify:CR=1 FL=1
MADLVSVIAQRFLLAAALALPVARRPDRRFVAHNVPVWEIQGPDQITVHVSPWAWTSLGNPRNPRAQQSVPVVTFHLQLARCVPGIGDTSAESLGNSAIDLLDDFEVIQAAVTESAGDIFGHAPVSFGNAIPLGPSGNVAGWEWPITHTVS